MHRPARFAAIQKVAVVREKYATTVIAIQPTIVTRSATTLPMPVLRVAEAERADRRGDVDDDHQHDRVLRLEAHHLLGVDGGERDHRRHARLVERRRRRTPAAGRGSAAPRARSRAAARTCRATPEPSRGRRRARAASRKVGSAAIAKITAVMIIVPPHRLRSRSSRATPALITHASETPSARMPPKYPRLQPQPGDACRAPRAAPARAGTRRTGSRRSSRRSWRRR